MSEIEWRKTIEYEAEMSKWKAEYQVQLDLQKEQEMLNRKEQMRENRRKNDEESVAR